MRRAPCGADRGGDGGTGDHGPGVDPGCEEDGERAAPSHYDTATDYGENDEGSDG